MTVDEINDALLKKLKAARLLGESLYSLCDSAGKIPDSEIIKMLRDSKNDIKEALEFIK